MPIGATVGIAGASGTGGPEVIGLALASALALAAVDVNYVWKGTLARIYLPDAAAEAVLIAAIFAGLAFA